MRIPAAHPSHSKVILPPFALVQAAERPLAVLFSEGESLEALEVGVSGSNFPKP